METVAKFLRNVPDSKTENGADTFSTSLNANLDLFAMGGALRSRSESDVKELVFKAFMEDPKLAIKNLFRIRDAREGCGERNTFRIALNKLGNEKLFKTSVLENFLGNTDKLRLIAEYGRWDDLFSLFGTQYESKVFALIKSQLLEDISEMNIKGEKAKISLLGKWLPSINASNVETRKLAFKIEKALDLNHKTYRQTLSRLRDQLNVLERNMSAKDYDAIEYHKVPSMAFLKHMKAFKTHDATKFSSFMEKVAKGEAKVNTGVLFPSDIVHKLTDGDPWNCRSTPSSEVAELSLLWDNLPNYLGDAGEQALVIADTSGSMSGTPIEVALSLAMYYAERNLGPWKDYFISFSARPTLQHISGSNLLEKFRNMANTGWDSNTNVELAFKLILDIAIKNKLTQDELPKKLYIVSDMEFDSCCGTNYSNAKELFEAQGYKLPTVVFWNVDARSDQSPVRFDEQGTMLVSGYSASVFRNLVGKEECTPVSLMLEVLNGPRYNDII